MRKRRLRRDPAHLEITAFINLIVVLVPFLLSTAVFTRLAVMDLALPAPSSGGPMDRIKAGELQLEVVIRRDAYEVGDRVGGLIQRIDRTAGGPVALKTLNGLMVQIKQRFPDKTEVSVLAEPDTPYDHLVQVMDSVRATVSGRTENGAVKLVTAELFPDIAIGDAPVRTHIASAAASGKKP
jgi:biopolymer transport protein ExbD